MTHAFLSELNSEQHAAVTAPDGPVLVLAGAGSGKTRAIVSRVAWLIETRGVAPGEILALTFTNKAADEMRSRVNTLLSEKAPHLAVHTFHALGLRLLRRFGGDVGLPSGFTLYAEGDRKSLLRAVCREMNLSERDYPIPRISRAVSILKHQAFSQPPRFVNERERENVLEIARRYQQALDSRQAVDFDGLLLRAIELLECSEAARRFADKRFRHVLVDEYQDTNGTQYRLLRLLAPHGNLFVVGDEDQSIYKFRGADIRNILDFEEDFPSARVFKLEKNYRSSAAILDAANALISENSERKGKRLEALKKKGTRPELYPAEDEQDEAGFVASAVERERQSDAGIRTAVLVRTHAQTRLFEEAFVARGIPHRVVGGLRFYERREIKDALAYLKLVKNPHDDASFLRAVNVPPRGVGPSTIEALQAEGQGSPRPARNSSPSAPSQPRAKAEGRAMGVGPHGAERRPSSLWEAVESVVEKQKLTARSERGLAAFRKLIRQLTSLSVNLTPSQLLSEMIERSGMERWHRRNPGADAEERLDNLKELMNAAVDYEAREPKRTLGGFLDGVTLLTDTDAAGGDAPCQLMTLHAAKGLEFDTVFIGGLEEGLFPHVRSVGDRSGLEEERRLCYVGMTRARSRLYLTYATTRRGSFQREDRFPSRFLAESGLVAAPSRQPPPQAFLAPVPSPRDAPGAGSGSIRKGAFVRHAKFGVGRVVQTDGGGKLTVDFDDVGRKRLVAKYAKLEVLTRIR